MIILERHSVVTSLAIKESPEIMKNKSNVAQMIPYPSWGTAVPRSRFVPLSGFVPRSGPDPDLMNNVRTWTSNCTHGLKGDAITHQCLNFNGGLLKPLLNYGYGCIIISHCFTFIQLLIHVVSNPKPWPWPWTTAFLNDPIWSGPQMSNDITGIQITWKGLKLCQQRCTFWWPRAVPKHSVSQDSRFTSSHYAKHCNAL